MAEEHAKLVSLAEVKNILRKISKERKELIYEQRVALEHAERFSTQSAKQSKDLIAELLKQEHIEEIHAYKIADILPRTVDDVKAIFAKERVSPNEKEIKTIIELVNKHSIE
jgi:DNA-directed RNA polymerase subunit F